MDADARPTKLRKLENGEASVAEVEAPVPLVSTSQGISPAGRSANPIDVESPGFAPKFKSPVKDVGSEETSSDVNLQTEEQLPNPQSQDLNVPSNTQPPEGTAEKPLSKNQLKKLRKREEWEAGREYRKVKRKQKIQQRKQRKRDERDEAALLRTSDKTVGEGGVSAGTQQQQQLSGTRPHPRRPVVLPVTIIIDCGFDDLMMEKERISLGSQLTRSYSDNSRAPFQTHLVISSWGGILKERFDTLLKKHHLNWKGVTFETENFVTAAEKANEVMRKQGVNSLKGIFRPAAAERNGVSIGEETTTSTTNPSETDEAQTSSITAQSVSANDQGGATTSSEGKGPDSAQQKPPEPDSSSSIPEDLQGQGEIVYLTSDSDYTLTTLKPYSTYIVGGLVDKNRHKGICYKTALNHNIKTAKLPIGEYLEMASRKVLATNHVVEIMIRYLECGDWGESFLQVIPKRKGGKLRSTSEEAGGEEDGDDQEDE